jgi:hypothetical protein
MSDPQDPFRTPLSDLHDGMDRRKLDVIAALREAYSGAWANLGEMVRLIWLPGSLYLALNVVGAMLSSESSVVLRLLIELASLMLWAIISVAWYRFILIGERPEGSYQINFSRREGRYLLVSLGLVMLAVPSLLFGGPPEFPPAASVSQMLASAGSAGSLLGFFGVMLSFVSIYFLIRLLLLLPAASIDEPFNVRMVLERTRGNFWRILALCILSSLPLLVVYAIIVALFVAIHLPLVVALLFSSLLSIFFAIVNVAVLAIAYRELIGPPGALADDLDRPNAV